MSISPSFMLGIMVSVMLLLAALRHMYIKLPILCMHSTLVASCYVECT